jgi:hypothetical protein
VVPLTALARSRDDPAVWIVDPVTNGEVASVTIAQFPGRRDGDHRPQCRQWVVTAGVQKLRPDQVVRLAASAIGVAVK